MTSEIWYFDLLVVPVGFQNLETDTSLAIQDQDQESNQQDTDQDQNISTKDA